MLKFWSVFSDIPTKSAPSVYIYLTKGEYHYINKVICITICIVIYKFMWLNKATLVAYTLLHVELCVNRGYTISMYSLKVCVRKHLTLLQFIV